MNPQIDDRVQLPLPNPVALIGDNGLPQRTMKFSYSSVSQSGRNMGPLPAHPRECEQQTIRRRGPTLAQGGGETFWLQVARDAALSALITRKVGSSGLIDEPCG
ncbi:hypothetical protein GCM10027403_23380 [Arthrobacter tecti]